MKYSVAAMSFAKRGGRERRREWGLPDRGGQGEKRGLNAEEVNE